ncbi:UNKNOWN [Stylonychia lemnae]|uniref:FMR1-interacting protein 1 conserved domain-containing protein n=1 Tax=Stylonychia lemnae TaxID=5949 RepID=A0A077ZP76_STYLE|nr:UNKNOWN [Stylonychia lemnae]|eukprot:CDW71190.1 UNKNOWN [Stylonychia lemnae]
MSQSQNQGNTNPSANTSTSGGAPASSFSFPQNPHYQQNQSKPPYNSGPRPFRPKQNYNQPRHQQQQSNYQQQPSTNQSHNHQQNQNYRPRQPTSNYQPANQHQAYQQPPPPGQYPPYPGTYPPPSYPTQNYTPMPQNYHNQQQQSHQPRNFNKNQQNQQQNYHSNTQSNHYNQQHQQQQNIRPPQRELTEEQKQERKRQQLREKKLKHTFGGNTFAQNFLFSKKNNDALVSAANSYAQQLISDQQKQIIGEEVMTQQPPNSQVMNGAPSSIPPYTQPQSITNNNFQVNFYHQYPHAPYPYTGAPGYYPPYTAPRYPYTHQPYPANAYGQPPASNQQTQPQAQGHQIPQYSIQSEEQIAEDKASNVQIEISDSQQQAISYFQDSFKQLQSDYKRKPTYPQQQQPVYPHTQQQRYNPHGYQGHQQNNQNRRHHNQNYHHNQNNNNNNNQNLPTGNNHIQQNQNTQQNKKPLDPEEEEDLQKWINQRRKNFPTRERLDQIKLDQQRREELGIQSQDGGGVFSNRTIIENKREEMSKIEIKLRRKLTLINGQLSERGGLKFLKNRSLNLGNNNHERNNRKKQRGPQERNKNPEGDEEVKESLDKNDQTPQDPNNPESGKKREFKQNLKDKKRKKKLRIQQQQKDRLQGGQALDGAETIETNADRKANYKKPEEEEENEAELRNRQQKIFKYRKNVLYDELLQNEKHKEAMILLQCFRYFIRNNIV